MMILTFLINNIKEQIRFLEKIFLLANVSLDIISRNFFLIWSNTNVKFLD